MSDKERVIAALIACGLDRDGYTAADLADIADVVITALS